jgi:chromosome segregation ATPase
MAVIDPMTSDVTSRLFEAARLIGLTDEHRTLLTEAGNTISSLRERVGDTEALQDKVKSLRETLERASRDYQKLDQQVNKQKYKIEELEADKTAFRKLAENLVDNI